MLLSVPVAGMAHKNHVGILNCKRDAVNCCCIDDNQYAGGLWFMDYKILTQDDLLELFPFGKTKLKCLLEAGYCACGESGTGLFDE